MDALNLFTSNQVDYKDNTNELNGGKGSNLITMKNLGYNVPSGFVIPTSVHNEYRSLPNGNYRDAFMEELLNNVEKALVEVYKDSPHKLLSIRSGAPVSMAGMMDTILNVGVGYGEDGITNKDLKLDCTKRFTSMFSNIVLDADTNIYDPTLDSMFDVIREEVVTTREVIELCIEAVFSSWDNPRAKHYRSMYGIPEDMGTAVVIQSMVFGNYDDNSGSGVMFTRNPNTGEKKPMGEYLMKCQGEDVVSGSHNPEPLEQLKQDNQDLYTELVSTGYELELTFKDMQDIEFTIQQGELYILQTRKGKRSAIADIVIANDLVNEGTTDNLTDTLTKGSVSEVAQPQLPEEFIHTAGYKGIPSGGALTTGRLCYSVEEVIKCKESAVLLSVETTPDDIKGMEAAVGIITTKGGATSHAAVVARGMNKPCIVGCHDITPVLESKKSSQFVLMDGQKGNIWLSNTKFDIDLQSRVPDNVADIIMPLITTDVWVRVGGLQELKTIEEHIYNVIIPCDDLQVSDLGYLSDGFDRVVLTTKHNKDSVSEFIGEPMGIGFSKHTAFPKYVVEAGYDNVYFLNECDYPELCVGDYTKVSELINSKKLGRVSNEMIDNVIGDKETLNKVITEFGVGFTVVVDKYVLDVLEDLVWMG